MNDINKQISEALTFEEIRALGRQALGVQFERGEGINERIIEQEPPQGQQSPVVSMPASSGSPKAYRVIYPHGNDRYEIYGADEKELDAKEAAIRGRYRQ